MSSSLLFSSSSWRRRIFTVDERGVTQASWKSIAEFRKDNQNRSSERRFFFLRWRDKIVDAGWPPFGFQKITDNCVVVMRTAKDARYLRGWPWTSPNESAGNDARSTADTPNTLPNLSTCPRTRATVLSGRWCNGCTDAFTSFSRAPWSKHHKKFSYLRLRGSCRCWKFARVKLISRRNKHFHQRTFLSCRPLVEQWRFLVASRSTCQNNKNFKYLQLLGSLKCG